MADSHAAWALDDETRTAVWDKFQNGPGPVGYNPSLIPQWTSPTVDAIAELELTP